MINNQLMLAVKAGDKQDVAKALLNGADMNYICDDEVSYHI